MAKHTFKVTVEAVSDNHGNPVSAEPVTFTAENHDDIFALVDRIGARGDDKRLAFFLGLKLFGETLLEDKDNPLYKDIFPAFLSFMKDFKAAQKAKRD